MFVGVLLGPLTVLVVMSAENDHRPAAATLFAVLSFLWQLGLLALVAPFGNYKRTRALHSFWPLLGLAYMVDMAWHCGVGIARISRRIRLDHPDQRRVTMTGRISDPA